MKNAIHLLNEDMQRHKVLVKLPGDSDIKGLYLIMITAKTSRLKDFISTYGDKITEMHKKLAKKIFGEKETESIYGVLVNNDMKMIFAFNREFADYDSKKEEVIFKDIDDVLINKLEVKNDTSQESSFVPSIRPPRPGGGGSRVMRYSLSEKARE